MAFGFADARNRVWLDAMTIRLDYALAMDAGSGCGLTDALLDAEEAPFRAGLARVRAAVDEGKLGFWDLPRDAATRDAVVEWAKGVDPAITDVLVLGIGGSSLGGRAVYEALGGPPELRAMQGEARRIHFPDNSDPWRLAHLLEALDPKKTLAIAISKSGGTAETAASLLVVREWLKKAEAPMAKHLVLVTDPKSGSLRKLAGEEGLTAFAIPPNVGGRFSVLTPVGLVPAALAGFDVEGLLAGADAMRTRCGAEQLRQNPAGLLAALHVLHHRLFGRHLHVLMPYADGLRGVAAWFVQLWAESLGKKRARDGRVIETGPTPIPAVGATDQHAQVQLFMEGPRDKLVSFVAVDAVERDLTIPKEEGPNAYLGGHGLAELLDAERRGTGLALAEDGRPSLTIRLPKLDAPSLGGLLFLWEAATALAGELYDIDAFDQPGVELGKRLAYGLLGREGFEAEAKRVRDAEGAAPEKYRL